jgi:hypothetical protein
MLSIHTPTSSTNTCMNSTSSGSVRLSRASFGGTSFDNACGGGGGGEVVCW